MVKKQEQGSQITLTESSVKEWSLSYHELNIVHEIVDVWKIDELYSPK